MGSFSKGKDEAVKWIRENFKQGATCLDVGACNGKWYDLLGDHLVMDAVEVWQPYAKKYELAYKYRMVFANDIRTFRFPFYDLVIFGDVIEHMTVEEAQRVLAYASDHCTNMVVAVPFLYEQGMKNNNPYEVHLQPDLTPELFDERYPGFAPIYMAEDYAYYVKTSETIGNNRK